MRKMMISKTNRMKSIIAFTLLIMFLFVGGCSGSPAKINTLEPDPDTYKPGIITMVTFGDAINLIAFGKGEMFVSIEWENAPPDSVVTEWVFSLSEYGTVFWYTTFTIPVPFPDGVITVKGHITHFDCLGNKLTKLDVSGMLSLLSLNCGYNSLTVLDVSKNSALRELLCVGNRLTNLDVSNNKLLTDLNCSQNQLSSLDVTNNVLLELLVCGWNQLTVLDVTNNVLLELLIIGKNNLTNLDVTNNSDLMSLWIMSNPLTSLDISNNKLLMDLRCVNNYQMVDLYVTNNILEYVLVNYCQLDAETLNRLFYSLQDVTHLYPKDNIAIWHNPGEDECDKSIAEAKGWMFITKETRYSDHDIEEIIKKYLKHWRNHEKIID